MSAINCVRNKLNVCTSFMLYILDILSMYRELLRGSLSVPSRPPDVRRMLRGWTESHPICPRTTCWEGPHLICLPTALPLALCHILKWIQTVEMSPSLYLSLLHLSRSAHGRRTKLECLQIWQREYWQWQSHPSLHYSKKTSREHVENKMWLNTLLV